MNNNLDEAKQVNNFQLKSTLNFWGALVTAVAFIAPSALATPFEIEFDLKKQLTKSDSTRTFQSEGIDLRVSAFSNENLLAGLPFEDSRLREYGKGLGIRSFEGGDNHTVDNNGTRNAPFWSDYLLFELSEPMFFGSVVLNAFGDTDIQAWIGNGAPERSLNGSTLSELQFFDLGANLGENHSRTAIYQNFSIAGNYLLLGALPNDSGDSFKVRSISFVRNDSPNPEVPEPATLLLLSAGLLGLQRRRNKQYAEQ